MTTTATDSRWTCSRTRSARCSTAGRAVSSCAWCCTATSSGPSTSSWWHPARAAAGDPPTPAWWAYDAVATTLALAGDAPGARLARRLRDAGPGTEAPGGNPLTRRVARWRRWAVLPTDCADALTRLLEDAADRGARGLESLDDDALADLLRGRDLADARLLVAALAPRLRAAAATEGARRG